MLTPQQLQQSPKSPRTEEVSRQVLPLSTLTTSSPEDVANYTNMMNGIIERIEHDTNKKEQSHQEFKQLLLALNNTLNNNSTLKDIAELKNITRQQSSDIAQLQKDNTDLTKKIATLNSHSSDPLTTFMSYCAIFSLTALTIGALLVPAKILAVCNHFLNQAMKT